MLALIDASQADLGALLGRPIFAAGQPLRISQVYGGGGNSDAQLSSDFIELFNAGPDAVGLAGWSLQYAAGSSASWQITPLGDVTIPGYGYLLVREAAGGSGSDGGTPLEAPDVSGAINLSATAGKVALVAGEGAIGGQSDAAVVDFIGYGDANEAETAPAAGLSNTTAALRRGGGCDDSDNNAADFEASAPAPRSTGSGMNPCEQPPTETPTEIPAETPTDIPTDTPTATPTETPTDIPTETPTETQAETPTDLPTATPTDTATEIPTETPIDTPTETPTETPTDLPTATPTDTATEIPTETPTETPTDALTVTPSETPTDIPTETPTDAPTSAPTESPAPSETATDTSLPTPAETATISPTAIVTLSVAATLTATSTLTPLATSAPTWTATPTETPVPLLTPSATPTDTESPTLTLSPVSSSGPTLAPTFTPTATFISVTPEPPQLQISEFLADPSAVSDANGEWIELFNPTNEPVNLRNWVLADLGGDHHVIAADLVIPAQGFVVLARNADAAVNGGVAASYQYAGVTLANSADAILLLSPDGVEVARVEWGATSGLSVTPGASYERTNLADPPQWAVAYTAWPGSFGDQGTPGTAYAPPPATPTPTEPPAPAETPTATATIPELVETPTAFPTPDSGPPPRILISEFMADPKTVSDSAGEWIELFNTTDAAVNLRDWSLADLGRDHYQINSDLVIPALGYVVLARNSDSATNGGVNVQHVYSGVTLGNQSDALVLLAPDGVQVDQVAWGDVSGLTIAAGRSYERTNSDDPARWDYASIAWPGSAGDWGSPGAPYVAPAPPTPVFTATPTSPPMPTPTLYTGPPPHILISEFMADPKAVSDANGEWIELYNADAVSVNLRGWILADTGDEQHVIAADLWLQPGEYLVLARNGDPAANGGVAADYVYNGLSLANGDDDILLLAPDSAQVDAVVWGGDSPLAVRTGVSNERVTPSDPAVWTTGLTPWPGSAGDAGTPGGAYVAPPTSTPTANATPPGGATPTPTVTPFAGPPPRIRISEIFADPQAVDDRDGEWIELYNADADAVNLRGWALADLGGEFHLIDADLTIQPGRYVVLARNGDFAANGGVLANYVYSGVALANKSDAVLLLAPNGEEVDRVVWGGESALKTTPGASLEKVDPAGDEVWETATAPWATSSGDLGSPGAAYAVPAATPTPTPTPAVSATPGATATVTPTGQTGPAPRILISEFLADPKAVNDSDGEWIELYNASGAPVNLNGWSLADLGKERFVIHDHLLIPPGGYIILARNGDPMTNGGVDVDYVYQSFTLANGEDEILLYTPDGSEADRVTWGGDSGLTTHPGSSLERTGFTELPQWSSGWQPWLESAGDLGTPGAAYQVQLITPTPEPTSTVAPGPWPVAASPGPLLIDEVYYQGTDEEFIALINIGAEPVDLSGWSIGDADIAGGSEGMLALPQGYQLGAGDIFVIARDGLGFRRRWGQAAQAEAENRDPDTPDLAQRRDLATGSLALNDSGDEVILLNPANEISDAVAYKKGEYAALGLSGLLQPPKDYSLQRVPDARYPTVTDVRHRFLFAPPRPFEARGLPLAQITAHPSLAENLQAVWGSLGAQSNFSDDFTAPPHYLLAAGGAQGLDFVAVADQNSAAPWRANDMVLSIPAWSWHSATGEQAVIYNANDEALDNADALLAYLNTTGALAQWQGKTPPDSASLVAVGADALAAPGKLDSLYKQWASAGRPLLPAGNSNPPLPGAIDPTPRYTGLAVTTRDESGVLEAISARRGWLTSAPGLWLTLQAEQASGEQAWMGSTLAPANAVTFHVAYGDRSGEVAGLAIWRNNQLVRQLDHPPADGRWSVTLSAPPDSFFYAVATQADGDFAVTAPVYILPTTDGRVIVNEVLPAPAADHNGDGLVDGEDEFIELYNPGVQPVSLAEWKLSDNRGDEDPARRYTFAQGAVINGGEYLLIWRKTSYINLNVDNDVVRLLRPDGSEADSIAWGDKPPRDRSISRIPDGQAWRNDAIVTPGRRNHLVGDDGNNGDSGNASANKHDDDDANAPNWPGGVSPTYGQADGPPGSVAHAKLYGLKAFVEFEATVVAPPGLFNQSIYVADQAPPPDGPYAGIGINIYLRRGDFPELKVGDRVRARGVLSSFRGEMELQVSSPDQIWRVGEGKLLLPLPVRPAEIGESLEGRLVTFSGAVSGWRSDSIYLVDPSDPLAAPVRVVVRTSLSWKRPYVNKGEIWQVTGIVSQLAYEAPWNGGYRVLVRVKEDLVKQRRTMDSE